MLWVLLKERDTLPKERWMSNGLLDGAEDGNAVQLFVSGAVRESRLYLLKQPLPFRQGRETFWIHRKHLLLVEKSQSF